MENKKIEFLMHKGDSVKKCSGKLISKVGSVYLVEESKTHNLIRVAEKDIIKGK